MTRQLTLDLSREVEVGEADFLEAPCNAEALAWVRRWPDWPARGAVLLGPAGSGKSHLLTIWRERAGARKIAGPALDRAAVPSLVGEGLPCAVDDADRIGDGRALLHLVNLARESGSGVMIATATPPGRWREGLPDLTSRLAALPTVSLAAPDDALIARLMAKLFMDRGLAVSPEVVDFMVRRMERSFAAAHRIVATLDAASYADGKGVTIPYVRQVLRAELGLIDQRR